eukprot:10679676-Alexandrium_andersonii.AAC.1
MKLLELQEACAQKGIRVPSKATRGYLILQLRSRENAPEDGNQVIDFGKHRGLRYDEVPAEYSERAIEETVQAGDNAGDGLKRLA